MEFLISKIFRSNEGTTARRFAQAPKITKKTVKCDVVGYDNAKHCANSALPVTQEPSHLDTTANTFVGNLGECC